MASNKSRFIVGIIIGLLIASLVSTLSVRNAGERPAKNANQNASETNPPREKETDFDKTQYSLSDPNSIWVVINKKRPLPANYVPGDLTALDGAQMRKQAAAATTQLMQKAETEQIKFKIISGYRSYQTQQSLYASYVGRDGQTAADTYSARAGHSEHQTGLAADLGDSSGRCDLETCFGDTAAGKWLADHAHEFGFIIRYPSDKTAVTGYQYEPWHIRFVGLELAREVKNQKLTLEEFFELGPAAAY